MKVLICGADDLIDDIFPSFRIVVQNMGFEPLDFDDRAEHIDNFKDWVSGSIKLVNAAHIVVFVLKHNSGKITWQTEYIEAISQGKPLIILVDKYLFTKYSKEYRLGKVKKKDSMIPAFQTLDNLLQDSRTPIKFSNTHEFEEQLELALTSEITEALIVFKDYNKRMSIIERVKKKDNPDYFKKLRQSSDFGIVKKVLLDVFENKEVRKRILHYFTTIKELSDEELINLLDDGEQGISRMTADLLPQLVGPENSITDIIDHLIASIEGTTEAGIIRRSIGSIFELDVRLAVDKLAKLFPAYDIGTPKRIVKWLLQNEQIIKDHSADKRFNKNLDNLIELCSSFSDKPESLKNMAEELKEKVIQIRNSK